MKTVIKVHKIFLHFCLIPFCLNCFTNCKSGLKNNTSIIIPEGFEIIEHDKDSDEILALNYKNEMQIIVSKNMSKIIKKGEFFGYGLMEVSMKTKFPRLVKQFNGTNIGEFKQVTINKNIYLHQNFEFLNGNGYYEFGGLYIHEPEEYFDIYISGDKTKYEAHRPIIRLFLEGVK